MTDLNDFIVWDPRSFEQLVHTRMPFPLSTLYSIDECLVAARSGHLLFLLPSSSDVPSLEEKASSPCHEKRDECQPLVVVKEVPKEAKEAMKEEVKEAREEKKEEVKEVNKEENKEEGNARVNEEQEPEQNKKETPSLPSKEPNSELEATATPLPTSTPILGAPHPEPLPKSFAKTTATPKGRKGVLLRFHPRVRDFFDWWLDDKLDKAIVEASMKEEGIDPGVGEMEGNEE